MLCVIASALTNASLPSPSAQTLLSLTYDTVESNYTAPHPYDLILYADLMMA